jgi:type IV pilus assembly protein PilY1
MKINSPSKCISLKLILLTIGISFSALAVAQYKAAYNDVNDIDGDNIPDLFFKPKFRYEGYFAYDRCYTNSALTLFTPDSYGTKIVVDATNPDKDYYKCPGKWSGNFLNWVTMARIDVLRKVLYGGKRSTDTATTVLERTFVPQDATMWGKEYLSVANDGYDISEYTPLALPTGGNRHMFANTTLQKANTADKSARFTATVNNPLMIVYANRSGRI